MTRRGLPAVVLALLGAVLLSGCMSMPTSGPVHEARTLVVGTGGSGSEYDPLPPARGATPAEIVTGFLDAMQAAPVQTTTARLFLTKDLAGSWDPQHETITYRDKTTPRGSQPLVVRLRDAHYLDARGTWQGSLPESRSDLSFRLTQEDGQWRISAAPNALVVPDSWFQQRYARMSLYFFDPTGRILVPEPVYVPRGEQLATALVRGLLRGPGPALQGVVRTFLPTGVSEGLSVPVSGRGLAEVDLSGDLGEQSPHAIQLMSAQLIWTLRQVDSVQRVRLAFDGRPVTSSTGASFPVSEFADYDPAGYDANTAIWGLRGGVLVTQTEKGFEHAVGGWGTRQPVRSVAVNLDATQAAGVTTSGRSVMIGSLGPGGVVGAAPVRGDDLLKPGWDVAGRLWLVDRTPRGARVSYLQGRAVTPVKVPGITGRDITSFVISRDGSRLVAVRHGEFNDDVVVSRLRSDSRGVVTGGSRARVIPNISKGPIRIADLAWHSPTEVVTLQTLPDQAFVGNLPVDGATPGAAVATQTIGDRVTGLVDSPVAGSGLYAVARRRLLDLSGRAQNIATRGVTALTYVG